MKTTLEDEPSLHSEGRQHPYEGGVHDQAAQYYDFKQHPELIPEVLEDFKPYDHFEAIQRFYEFLAWMNGEDCSLETNDCALRYYEDEIPKRAEGRVSVLIRNERLNLISGFNTLLTKMYYQVLSDIDEGFEQGCFTIKRFPTYFINSFTQQLPLELENAVIDSFQTIIGFEATGSSTEEVMDNLLKVIKTLDKASQNVEEVFEPVSDLTINIAF